MDSHRASGAAGSTDRRIRVDFKFPRGYRVSVGVWTASVGEARERYFEICGCVHVDDGFLRAGYVDLPASLPGTFSSVDSSSLAVVIAQWADRPSTFSG